MKYELGAKLLINNETVTHKGFTIKRGKKSFEVSKDGKVAHFDNTGDILSYIDNQTNQILFKVGRKIICYIVKDSNGWVVKTGKPSDVSCLSWHYHDLESAKKTANEYFENYKGGVK